MQTGAAGWWLGRGQAVGLGAVHGAGARLRGRAQAQDSEAPAPGPPFGLLPHRL